MADSFNELMGLGSHSADADLELWLPCQDDAASSTVVAEVGSNGSLTSGNTSTISTTGPNSWLTKALDIDGTPHIDLPSLSGLGDDLTLLMMIKSATATGQKGFGRFGEATGSSYSTHYTWYGSIYADIWRYNGSSHSRVTVGAPSATVTNWLDLCCKTTPGAGGWQFRLDGSDEATASGISSVSTSSTWEFGQSNAYFVDALVAHIGVFSRKLSDSDEAEYFAGPEPVNSVAPVVSGTEEVGETLSCTTGTWGIDSPFSGGSNGTVTYGYQWTRSDSGSGLNEADISGATSSSYTLVSGDSGKYIRCRVRATNDGGYDPDADANSGFTGAITGGGGSIIPQVMHHRRLLGCS